MTDLFDIIFHPSLLIGLAIAFQSASFLLTGQLTLRLMFLVGTIISIVYYLFVLRDPVWEPVVEDLIMGVANLVGLFLFFIGRSDKIIPTSQRALYKTFDCFQPGEFRALMKHGRIRDIKNTETLTVKGEVPDRLFYLIDGSVSVERDGQLIWLEKCDFIGEISLILGTSASATTQVHADSTMVEWDRKSLSAAMDRNEALKMSLEAALAVNMAHKVARSPQVNQDGTTGLEDEVNVESEGKS